MVARDQGIFPEGKSTSHDQGLSTVCASPRHVEKTLVLKSGPGAGSSVSPVIVSDGRVSHRLGNSHEWPRGGEADMENVLSGRGGPLRKSSECAMSPLVLSSSSSSPRTGRYGTDMAEAASVRLSPDRSAPRSSDESTPRRCSPTVSSPVLAGPSMVLGPDFPPRRLSMGGSHQEGSPLTSRGCHSAPPPELWKLCVRPLRGHSS